MTQNHIYQSNWRHDTEHNNVTAWLH